MLTLDAFFVASPRWTQGGRVKTLHPAVHAGLLADRRNADHVKQMEDAHLEAIDLVVCNLYPFQQVIIY